jgi:ATP-dependent Clp protease ATP-binding subunit ClpA
MHSGPIKFDESARRILVLAQEEAKRFNHNYIGTEHILLGLLRVEDGLAAQALQARGVDLLKVRSAVDFIIGRGERQVLGDIGLTPRAKKVIDLAVDEAKHFGHDQVATEHILLGLIREGEGIAAGVLESLGVNLQSARDTVLQLLEDLENAGRSRADHVSQRTAAGKWEYVVIPTAMHDGEAFAEPFYSETESLPDISHARIDVVIDILAERGWSLAGVDVSSQTQAERGPLYVLKRLTVT